MVMGPDCGTAIVNGVPLGFANVVRRGPIGVVGASGTGTQEVTVRIHQRRLGRVAGARHRRPRPRRGHRRHLDAARAGRARRRPGHEGHRAGLQAAGAEVVAAKVLAAAEASAKPVVVIFLGADPAADHAQRRVRRRLPRAGRRHGRGARRRRAARRRRPSRSATRCDDTLQRAGRARWRPAQRYVRGIFSGGTFCFEAQLVHRGRASALFQHADRRATAARRHRATARRTRSSTWVTTSSPRAARTR